jgi:hypothetical protein
MLIIRKAQMDSLSKYVRQGFVERLADYLGDEFPEEVSKIGRPPLVEFIEEHISKAAGCGIESERDVSRYVYFMFAVSAEDDPKRDRSWVEAVLSKFAMAPGARLDGLYEREAFGGGGDVEGESNGKVLHTGAVKETYEALWNRFPELQRRRLTLSNEDMDYRDIWWDLYETAKEDSAKGQKAPFPNALAPVGSTVSQHSVPEVYGTAVRIDGDEVFRKKTIEALDQIKRTLTGRKLLDSISKGDHTVTIVKSTEANSWFCTSLEKAFVREDGSPAEGSGSVVRYNPDLTRTGNEAWETRPPAIGLAYVLIHAERAATGRLPGGDTPNDGRADPSDPTGIQHQRRRDVEAVGIVAETNYEFTENEIRSEWDPPQPLRTWY